MSFRRRGLFIGFFLAAMSFTTADAGDPKVRIRVDLKKAGILRKQLPAQVDIAGQDLSNSTVDLVGSQEYFDLLKRQGYPVTIVETQGKDVDEKYLRPEKINVIIQQLAESFPEIVHVERIGDSLRGRPILAVRLSTKENLKFKPSVLFNGMHHAREVMTSEITTDMMLYLAKNFDNLDTPWVSRWLENLAIWIVPQVNPDGNAIVWQSDNWWRKNSRGDENATWGVDLNRNYPYLWNGCRGSSSEKSSQTYRGEAPASEPETQALMKLVLRENISLSVSYHSFSELVISPYGCPNTFLPGAERTIVDQIGWGLAKRLKKDDAKDQSYNYGSSWDLLYPVDGDDISWMYNELNTLAYVVEVNSAAQGFQPDYDKWRKPTVLSQRVGWQYLLNRVMTGAQVRGRMLDAKTGAPVEGTVTIAGVPYRTEKPRRSKDGVYFKILTPGSYELIFSAAGYQSQSIAFSIDENGVITQDILFEPREF